MFGDPIKRTTFYKMGVSVLCDASVPSWIEPVGSLDDRGGHQRLPQSAVLWVSAGAASSHLGNGSKRSTLVLTWSRRVILG